jgi:hypothetical protein
LKDDIPEDVEQIVERAMKKDPDSRYQSMAELADAIRKAVSMEPATIAGTRPAGSFISPPQLPDPLLLGAQISGDSTPRRNAGAPSAAYPGVVDRPVPIKHELPQPLIAWRVEVTAGDGSSGFSGDGGPAITSRLHEPRGVTVARDGVAYVADTRNNRIRSIDPGTGVITTVAGSGTGGFAGDGGPAVFAQLNGPQGLCVAGDGTLYISDTQNNRVRMVNPRSGIIETVVGNGKRFYTEHMGPATDLSVGQPIGMSVTANGRFLVVVGTGGPIVEIRGIRQDRPHAIHVVDTQSNRLWKLAGMTGNRGFSADGTAARSANLDSPRNVAIDPEGNVYVADVGNNVVRKIDSGSLEISTVAGNGEAGNADGLDGSNALAVPLTPLAVAVGPTREIFILERSGNRIRMVDRSGRIMTVFGGYAAPGSDDRPSIDRRIKGRGISLDDEGNIWFADAGNHVVTVIKRPE